MAMTTSPGETATSSVMVLVGTTKGLFTLRSSDGRESFELAGPTFAGEEVYSTCIDTRSGSTRLFTGSVSNHWGPVLRRSDDLGATWTEDEQAALRFPESADASLARIWQLAPGPADEPDVMYAGVEPAALFRSDDGGRSFSLVTRVVGPPAPPAVATGRRRDVPAHRPRPPRGSRPPADRHLGGRGLPIGRRRHDVARRATAASSSASSPTARTSSSASACTRWPATPAIPSASTSSTTAASTAATTAARSGRR